MCDNEYVAHVMVKERLREAEARGAFNAMVRAALASAREPGADRRDGRTRPTRWELWRQVTAAWAAHLTLPKIWNRL